jgi:hypothetical protein
MTLVYYLLRNLCFRAWRVALVSTRERSVSNPALHLNVNSSSSAFFRE